MIATAVIETVASQNDMAGSSRVSVLASAPHRVELVLDDVTLPVANAIRHALMKDVPVLAPDVVEIVQYNGQLQTEMVAHRIGLLPVACNDGQTPHPDATAVFELDVTWDRPTPGWVTSDLFVCVSGDAHIVHFRSDAEAKAAHRDTGFPLFMLHQHQRAHIRAVCRVGTGAHHARWNAVYAHFVETSKTSPTSETSSYHFIVETTGAVTPQQAWQRGLEAVYNRLRRVELSA